MRTEERSPRRYLLRPYWLSLTPLQIRSRAIGWLLRLLLWTILAPFTSSSGWRKCGSSHLDELAARQCWMIGRASYLTVTEGTTLDGGMERDTNGARSNLDER